MALAVASQDTTAFGELIRRHQSQVRNFLRKLAADTFETRDAITVIYEYQDIPVFSACPVCEGDGVCI